jgi:hypothetical protein
MHAAALNKAGSNLDDINEPSRVLPQRGVVLTPFLPPPRHAEII